jgi:hypothetical protein
MGNGSSVKARQHRQLMNGSHLKNTPCADGTRRGVLAAPFDFARSRLLIPLLLAVGCPGGELPAAELAGSSIIPHTIESSMRFRRPRDTNLAARVQLFVQGPARPTRFNGSTPAELLATNQWAWHDLGTAVPAPEGALTVWSFNGRSSRWGVGHSFRCLSRGCRRRP